MALDLRAVGRRTEPHRLSWTSADALLYAVAVGAGQDPADELALTTENTEGVPQQVLPSFGVVVGQRVLRPDIGAFDPTQLVHAEQHIELMRPLPASGEVLTIAEVEAIEDKGKGALVWTRTASTDVDTGEPIMTARSAAYIKGYGGFATSARAGAAGETWTRPTNPPDAETVLDVRPEQALLYRLTGDRNPLHSDPAFAARGGFPRPILHGMCTFGFTCRALVRLAAGGDPARLVGMGGRFTKPVWPGDKLEVRLWRTGNDLRFQTLRGDGEVAIDRGWARVAG